jgi:hypothetical protein
VKNKINFLYCLKISYDLTASQSKIITEENATSDAAKPSKYLANYFNNTC